jgi:hypothetical protein
VGLLFPYRQLQKIAEAGQRHSQGLLVTLVLFVGGSSVVLGAVSLKRSIYTPFAPAGGAAPFVSSATNDATRDTDGDGLSDHDELNTYATSPYLPDSDSDGIADGEELKQGKDPNCPEEKTCTTGFSAAPPSTTGLGLPIFSAPARVGSRARA